MYDNTPISEIPDERLEEQRQREMNRLVDLTLESDDTEAIHLCANRAKDILTEINVRARRLWDELKNK